MNLDFSQNFTRGSHVSFMFAHFRGLLKSFVLVTLLSNLGSLGSRAGSALRHKNRLLLKPHWLMTNLYFDTALSKFFLCPPLHLLQIIKVDRLLGACEVDAALHVRDLRHSCMDKKLEVPAVIVAASALGPGVLGCRVSTCWFFNCN